MNRNCMLYVGLLLTSVSFSSATEVEAERQYFDTEFIDSLRRPLTIPGDYSLAISIAYSEFVNRFKISDHQRYSMTVVELDDCYFIQIVIRLARISTATPSSYCVDKDSYKVNYLSDEEVRKIIRDLDDDDVVK